MKKIFLTVILLMFNQILFNQQIDSGTLQLFLGYPKGLNTKQSSHLILDDEFQDCSNVLFDKEYGPVVRGGNLQSNTSVLSTASIQFMWEYPRINNNKYMIILSSNILAYSTNVTTFTILLSTTPLNAKIWAVNYNNWCYLGFSSSSSWKFNGSDLFASTSTPQIRYATIYKDKIIGVNVNETGGKSKLVYSDVGFPEIWPLLNYIYIDRDDGDEITGIKVYHGNLYVFKKNSIFLITGLEDGYATNDGYYKIINGIGCLYNETIQEKEGLLYFVSARGIEIFDGINIKLVSDRIDPDIKNLTQSYSDTLVWGETTASDFADGTMFNVDATTISNSVRWNGSATVNTNINIGGFNPITDTSIAIDTTTNNPHISYYSQTQKTLNYSSHTSTGWFTSTVDSIGTAGEYNCIALNKNRIPCVSYQNVIGYDLKFASWTSIGWSTHTVNSTGDVGWFNSMAFDSSNNPHISYYNATNRVLAYSSYTSVGWITSTVNSTAGSGSYTSIKIDSANHPHIIYTNVSSGYIYYSSHTSTGWFTSTVDSSDYFAWTSMSLDSSNNPHISYQDFNNKDLIYSSYTSAGWIKSVVDSAGGVGQYTSIKLDSSNNAHISYIDTINDNLKYSSYTTTGWVINTLDSVGIVGWYSSLALDSNNIPHISYDDSTNYSLKYLNLSSGVYTSANFNANSSEYSWGGWQNFKATENLGTGVTMNYYTRTSPTGGGLDTASWQQIVNNSFSKSNDGSWIQYKFEFIPTIGAGASRIDDVSIDYGVDSQNKPLVSTVLDRRYMLAGAIRPAINNNIVYCLDQNNNWTKFNNMYVRAFCNFRNELYFSVSTDTFQINKYSEDYTDDNGVAIAPFIQTKDYDFGAWINDKYFADLWTYFEPSIIYSNATVSFYLNKLSVAEATKTISLLADTTYPDSTLINKIRNDADRWRYINFKVSNFDKFYGLIFKYGIHGEGEK